MKYNDIEEKARKNIKNSIIMTIIVLLIIPLISFICLVYYIETPININLSKVLEEEKNTIISAMSLYYTPHYIELEKASYPKAYHDVYLNIYYNINAYEYKKFSKLNTSLNCEILPEEIKIESDKVYYQSCISPENSEKYKEIEKIIMEYKK